MWILIRDYFVLDGCFDDEQEAIAERRRCQRMYQGYYEVRQVSDDWLYQYMKSVEDLDFVHAIGNSYQ